MGLTSETRRPRMVSPWVAFPTLLQGLRRLSPQPSPAQGQAQCCLSLSVGLQAPPMPGYGFIQQAKHILPWGRGTPSLLVPQMLPPWPCWSLCSWVHSLCASGGVRRSPALGCVCMWLKGFAHLICPHCCGLLGHPPEPRVGLPPPPTGWRGGDQNRVGYCVLGGSLAVQGAGTLGQSASSPVSSVCVGQS